MCESVKESVNRFFMNKFPVCLCFKKQIQIKSVLLGFTVYFHTLLKFLTDYFRHLICKEIEFREIFVRIIPFRIVPVRFCFLFIGVGPVEYGVLREFIICESLERCSRKMKRMISFYLMKSDICFGSVHSLVCLINNEQFPLHIDKFFQLVEFAAEIQ